MTPWSPLDGIPEDIVARAARVRLACFAVDGVMTDGGLYYSDLGHESKRFHVMDGLGLKMLLESGIHVVVITARDTPAVAKRMQDLGIRHVFAGVPDKRACMFDMAARLGLGIEDVAHVGDDFPDLGLLGTVGFAIAVANAHPVITPCRALADAAQRRPRRRARGLRTAACRPGKTRGERWAK